MFTALSITCFTKKTKTKKKTSNDNQSKQYTQTYSMNTTSET